MRERDSLGSKDDEFEIQNLQINQIEIEKYRQIIKNHENFIIRLNKLLPTDININKFSFLKINFMNQTFPEETINFIYQEKIFFTPRNSFRISNSSSNTISSVRKSVSSKNTVELERFLNLYIPDKETSSKIKHKYTKSEFFENDFPTEPEITDSKIIVDNIMHKEISENINKKLINKKKFDLYNYLYHFYFYDSLIFLIHLITFIFSSHGNYSIFFWSCILLIISMLFIGYKGVFEINKNKNMKYTNKNNMFFNNKNLFWINFVIFCFTIITFISLVFGHQKFILNQSVIGFLFVLVYLLTIFFEIILLLYFDIISKDILSEIGNNQNNVIYEKKIDFPLLGNI